MSGQLATIRRGMVTATEFLMAPNGHQVRNFAGKIAIVDAKTAFGFTPGERDHTWYVQVTCFGDAKVHLYIPGCKVAAITDLGDREVPGGEVWY